MLFDLQSPRRRVAIKIIYGLLAVLIGGSLVLTNFGGNDNGIADLFGGDSADPSELFNDQINEAQEKVDLNPQDPAALLELARSYANSGKSQVEVDQSTGAPQPNADATEDYQRAADAWDRYLKAIGDAPADSGAAILIADGFFFVAQTATDAGAADRAIKDAAEAQKVVSEGLPGTNTLYYLALYSFFAGETKQAEQAVKDLEPLIPENQRKQLTQEFDEIAKNAKTFRKQVEDAAKPQPGAGAGAGGAGAPSTSPFQNPLQTSPLGGGGLGG
jgi:tetratricopeptide (TPR) repeat protein